MNSKRYSVEEIKKRTSRLQSARNIRSLERIKKDEIVYWMIKQVYPNGLLMSNLVSWGIFDRTFLTNSLKRLEDDELIYKKKEYHDHDYIHSRLLNRYFIKIKIPIGHKTC